MRTSSCLVWGNERCKIDLDGPKGKYGVVRESKTVAWIQWLGRRWAKNKRAELLAHGG